MIYTLMNQKKAVLDLNYDEDFQAATEITAIYNSAYGTWQECVPTSGK